MQTATDYTPRQRDLLRLIEFANTRAADKKLEREITQEQWNRTLEALKADLVALKTGIDLHALFE